MTDRRDKFAYTDPRQIKIRPKGQGSGSTSSASSSGRSAT